MPKTQYKLGIPPRFKSVWASYYLSASGVLLPFHEKLETMNTYLLSHCVIIICRMSRRGLRILCNFHNDLLCKLYHSSSLGNYGLFRCS